MARAVGIFLLEQIEAAGTNGCRCFENWRNGEAATLSAAPDSRLSHEEPHCCFSDVRLDIDNTLFLNNIAYLRLVECGRCQYSSDDGFFNDWHLMHLGQFAVGGAGTQSIPHCKNKSISRIGFHGSDRRGAAREDYALGHGAVERLPHGQTPRHCATDPCAGSTHRLLLLFFVDYFQGGAAGIQLAHAGRKGSTKPPWLPPDSTRPLIRNYLK